MPKYNFCYRISLLKYAKTKHKFLLFENIFILTDIPLKRLNFFNCFEISGSIHI